MDPLTPFDIAEYAFVTTERARRWAIITLSAVPALSAEQAKNIASEADASARLDAASQVAQAEAA